jgi:hypothetical protein
LSVWIGVTEAIGAIGFFEVRYGQIYFENAVFAAQVRRFGNGASGLRALAWVSNMLLSFQAWGAKRC